MENESNPKDPILLKLKSIRKERGLSIGSLAERLGADYQKISRLERGKSQLTVDWLLKISKALNTPVAQIIQPSGEEKGKGSLSSFDAEPADYANSAAGNSKSKKIDNQFLSKIFAKVEGLLSLHQLSLPTHEQVILSSEIYNQITEYGARSKASENLNETVLDVALTVIHHVFSRIEVPGEQTTIV